MSRLIPLGSGDQFLGGDHDHIDQHHAGGAIVAALRALSDACFVFGSSLCHLILCLHGTRLCLGATSLRLHLIDRFPLRQSAINVVDFNRFAPEFSQLKSHLVGLVEF